MMCEEFRSTVFAANFVETARSSGLTAAGLFAYFTSRIWPNFARPPNLCRVETDGDFAQTWNLMSSAFAFSI